ncbi:MAG: ABC transporter permease [Gemmatimonadetes bacterium]|nr:ABC transporter permease [Gemmatimonadota bacterium]
MPDIAVLSREEFAENNMEELRGGLLPILSTIAVLGAVNAVAVLALMLYGSVLERREDYAVLKAMGASQRVLALLIVRQSLAAVGGGLVFGIVAYYVFAPVVLRIVPEMLLELSMSAILAVAAGAFIAGLLGALGRSAASRGSTPLRCFAHEQGADERGCGDGAARACGPALWRPG